MLELRKLEVEIASLQIIILSFYFICHCFLICHDSYCKGKIMDKNKKSLVNKKK